MAKPNTMRVATKNLKELQKLLKAGESAIEVKDLRQVFLEGVRMIQAAALVNVRRLFKPHTGNLEKSLIAMMANNPAAATAFTKSRKSIAPHAHLLEFGHRIVGRKPGKTDTGKVVQGRAWFRPALDATKADVRRHINSRLAALLKTAFVVGHSSDDTGWVG